MRSFSLRGSGTVRLAAAASFLVAFAGCPSEKKPGGFTQTQTWSISGTITGPGAANVTVRIQGGSRKATTDSLGNYTIGNLYDGTYTLEPSRAGFAFVPATLDVTIAGADATGRDFVSVQGVGIVGKVTGDGKDGVTIALKGPLPATTTVTTTTDPDGNYVFPVVAAGSYTVTPSLAGGWTFSPANCLVTVTTFGLTGPDFASIAATHKLSGKVTGAVTAGVLVTLSGDADSVTVTDASGDYAFAALPSGSYTVTPALAGYAFTPADAAVTIGTTDATVPSFAAAATHRIAGRVSGDVWAGVSVSLSGAATGSVTTDAGGYFEFAGLANGAYVVKVALDGYAFTPASRPVTLAGADQTAVNFTAISAALRSVSGSITGTVLSEVTLTLQGPQTLVTTAGGTGAFDFPGVPAGDYLLVPSNEDYVFDPASRLVAVRTSDVTGQTFAATLSLSARTITGRVAGDVVAGVTVTLVGPSPATTTRTATTDASGRFAFRNLADGDYLATPTFAGQAFFPTDCLVTVAGPSVTAIEFASLTLPHAISGTISGAVASGVLVELTGDATLSTTTAFDGSYSFPNLPNGSYKVAPSLAGYVFAPAELSVTLQGANATGTNFVAYATHRISGTITGPSGVTVKLTGAAERETTTGAGGAFAFTDLTDGAYVVTPSLDGYTFDPQFLPVALAGGDFTAADFVATAIPTWTVSGTITGPGAIGTLLTLTGAKASSFTTVGTGAFSFSGLPNGSYMLIPSRPGYAYTPGSRAFRVNDGNVTGENFVSVAAP